MIRTAEQLAKLPAPAPASAPGSAEDDEHQCIAIRTGLPGDVKFLDHLQKKYSHQVGFLPMCALEAYVERGNVSIALENDEPAAYLLGKGNYLNDPHFGIIYQAAVSYDARRRLLGTALVQHFMDRMEPNVRLIGLWCAQDIEANEFWSACGFEPIAARHGSRRKGRVHIFWVGKTGRGRGQHEELRYPKATRGGLMREKREVYGLPPGSEYKEVVLPPAEVEGLSALGSRPSAGARKRKAECRKPTASLIEMQRAFRYGCSRHICVVICGATRYLPVAPFDVPDFADVARTAVAHPGHGGAHAADDGPRIARNLWTPAADDSREAA